MSGTIRDRWRREVLATPRVSDSVRVLLLVLADHMDARGYVSVPRNELARILGRAPRRINERLAVAVEARLLDPVARGQVGRTAVYAALLPAGGVEKGADGRPLRRGRSVAPSRGRTGAPWPERDKGADGGPASTTAGSALTASARGSRPHGQERDDGTSWQVAR